MNEYEYYKRTVYMNTQRQNALYAKRPLTIFKCVFLVTPGNRHYDEIQRQVAAGTLTIQDAD